MGSGGQFRGENFQPGGRQPAAGREAAGSPQMFEFACPQADGNPSASSVLAVDPMSPFGLPPPIPIGRVASDSSY